MKIYLAARYSAKGKVAALADQLEDAGHKVTSRWCRRADNEPDVAEHRSIAEAGSIGDIGRQFAVEDAEDVLDAEALVLLSCFGISRRGGMFVEVGLAFGADIPTVLCGDRTNVFDTLHERECAGPGGLAAVLDEMAAAR